MTNFHKYQVVIIGAGVAGLTCAKHLIDNGIDDFIILEADEQIGGRIKTLILEDHVFDLGAQWIYGKTSNPIYDLAEDNNLIDDVDTDSDEKDDYFHDQDGESIDEDLVDEIQNAYDEIIDKVNSYPVKHYPDLSLGEFICAEVDNYLVKHRDDINRSKQVFDWLMKEEQANIGCNRLTDVSIQGWNAYEEFDDKQEINLKYGYSQLLTILMKSIPYDKVKLNTIVKRIEIGENDDEYVEVETIDSNNEIVSEHYHSKYVVCTMSLGVLKQTINQLFHPPLPQAKRTAIQKLGFGTVDKIFLVFEKSFWDADYNSFQLLWDNSISWTLKVLQNTKFNVSMIIFDVARKQSNVLVTFMSGETAKYVENMPDDLLAYAFQELLSRFFTDLQVPVPIKIIRSQWNNDHYIQGSHTFIKIGSTTNDIKSYAFPVLDKKNSPLILFAGEGTHEKYYSTTHGAYLSGIREAQRIIEDFTNY
ncbi:unnamed protein product [Didymodactylos carnosus]|uniref:Amine oxidase domain-containing protein n=1 Tax=Didymodactylos carnosus TaxID=1234261 RepID=A0A814IU79_9BILA|nr:unnamed protein product [Didymodactylos carnosus]CAF1028556.1 unnamed protein product [Didymodactylos carnosus]CAF3531962.1 unnamed protein product [Didymodactylos carnosus]CAF3799466.1 unnamed protein product [Didymodactylos carnosus]